MSNERDFTEDICKKCGELFFHCNCNNPELQANTPQADPLQEIACVREADPQDVIKELQRSYQLLKIENTWLRHDLVAKDGIASSYHCKHIPTGENWHLLGIDKAGNRVCAAGYPPTIGKLSDCTDIVPYESLTHEELIYRNKQFGGNWDKFYNR